jgi:hypothetical protein
LIRPKAGGTAAGMKLDRLIASHQAMGRQAAHLAIADGV